MAENNANVSRRHMIIRHRGRGAQVGIYLGKLLRMFVYQNDWKVLPMAALIAGLVGMVIRRRLFITMEGTLLGAFAMVMVCIWNGCFNSIQVICRERDVIKREHRSGMHISSYIASHMIYQALLCLMQTAVTLYITKAVGVKYPAEGLFTKWMIVDYGISMFLITYASDMMSLWISCLARTTTTAMTIMPFVLIFQLVFSGGMITLPSWGNYLTPFTISNPAVSVLTAQGDYNHRPVMTIWDQVNKMRDREVSATVTLGQVLETLGSDENPTIAKVRSMQLSRVFTLGEIREMLEKSESFKALREEHVLEDVTIRDVLKTISESENLQAVRDYDFGLPGITLGKIIQDLLASAKLQSVLDMQITKITTVGEVLDAVNVSGFMDKYKDIPLGKDVTLGQLVDTVRANADVQTHLDDSYTFSSTIGDIIQMVGEDKAKDILQNKVGESNAKPEYDNTAENIFDYWLKLMEFILVFAALATITLEFIDKDKR